MRLVIEDSHRQRRQQTLIVSLLLAGCIGLTCLTSARAIEKADENKLAAVEKKMFFKTYASEAMEKRLDRLEKRFFGEPSSGSVEQRLQKVFEAAGPQIEEQPAKPPQMQTSEPSQESSASQPAGKSKSPSRSKPAKAPASAGANETDMAWERANLSAQAQRDAEIRNLLKEGIRLWKRKDADQAIEKFNQVIRLDPENAEAHFSLGVIFEARGQLNEADAAYRKAHDSNPDSLEYKDAITTVQEKLGKQQEGQARQSEIDKQAQEAAEAFKRKEYLTAIELYKKLANDYPKNAAYKYNIGTIYLIMGSPVQALEYYEMARKLNPKEERYIAACQKLKDTVQEDAAKRKSANEAWDDKEDQDKRAARERQKEKERQEKERRLAAAGKAPHKPKSDSSRGGKNKAEIGTSDMERMLQGFNQQSGSGQSQPAQRRTAPTQSMPLNNQTALNPQSMPKASQPGGFPSLNTQAYGAAPNQGYTQTSPGFTPPGQASPVIPQNSQGYMPQGFNQQGQGFNQQSQAQGFMPNSQAQSSPGFTPVPQGFPQSSPGLTNSGQGFQQSSPGFTPLNQGFNQNGFSQPGYSQGQMGSGQMQFGQGGQGFTQGAGFNPGMQGYPMGGNSQAFNAGFQGGQGMNAGSPGFNQGGQAFGQNGTGYGGQVSQLTQPSGSQGAGQGQTGTAPAHHSAPHTASPAGHAGSHAGSAQSAAKPLSGPELLASLGIIAQPTAKGVTVTTIGIGSRAAKAGIAPGDVVLAVDGVSVQSLTHFAALLSHKHQGESAKLLINRQGTIGQVVL